MKTLFAILMWLGLSCNLVWSQGTPTFTTVTTGTLIGNVRVTGTLQSGGSGVVLSASSTLAGSALALSGTIPITQVGNLPTLLATGTTALTNAATAQATADSKLTPSVWVSGSSVLAAQTAAAQAFSIQRANHTGTQLANTISNFAATSSAAAPVQSVSGRTGAVTLTSSDVGLGNVDNTSLTSWPGGPSLASLGTVIVGTWHATPIGDTWISSASTWNAKLGASGSAAIVAQIPTNTNQLTNGAGFITSSGSAALSGSATLAGTALNLSGTIAGTQVTGTAVNLFTIGREVSTLHQFATRIDPVEGTLITERPTYADIAGTPTDLNQFVNSPGYMAASGSAAIVAKIPVLKLPTGTVIVADGDSITTSDGTTRIVSITTTSGTNSLAVNGEGTLYVMPGQTLLSPGIPANTKIVSVTDLSHVVLSGTATASATVSGTFSGTNWPTVLATLSSATTATIYNYAVGGTTIANAVTSYTANVHALRPSVTGAPRSIYMAPVGGNDLPTNPYTVLAAMESLWNTAKADGFEVWAFTLPNKGYSGVAGTLTDINSGGNANNLGNSTVNNQQILNDLIRNSSVPDHLIDLDRENIEIQVIDGTHPTVRGVKQIAQIVNYQLLLGGAAPAHTNLNPVIANITAAYGQGVKLHSYDFGQGNQTFQIGLHVDHQFANNNTLNYSSEVTEGLRIYNHAVTSAFHIFGDMVGLHVKNYNESLQIVDNSYGQIVETGDVNGGGVGNNYGLYIKTPSQYYNGGHITNNYALYVEPQQQSGSGGITGETYSALLSGTNDVAQINGYIRTPRIVSSLVKTGTDGTFAAAVSGTDYATGAQGTLATNALPATGGTGTSLVLGGTTKITALSGTTSLSGVTFTASPKLWLTCSAVAGDTFGNTSVPGDNTSTKLVYNKTNFDTDSIWNSGNNRIIPTRAGYFLVCASIQLPSDVAYTFHLYVYKNGSQYDEIAETNYVPESTAIRSGQTLVYCNGTTDYIEIYVKQGSGGALLFEAGNGTRGGVKVSYQP